MKQHITIEQLHELSPKATGEIGDWYLKKHPIPLGVTLTTPYYDQDLCLSIGQMIEFLDEYINEVSEDGEEYTIERLMDGCFRIDGYYKSTEYDELCDALWEAVKEVLETKKQPTDLT